MIGEEFELFWQPREQIKKADVDISRVEMTDYQSSFLCGLIKKYKPQKIVEVGVSAGGTTAIILKCLDVLSIDATFYSIDISKEYYLDTDKPTGYLANEMKNNLNHNIRHEFMLGRSLPDELPNIGEGIDLLILDTMHVLPGELLDFIIALPYLKKEGIVVLHDVCLHQLYSFENKNPYAHATRVLLDSVVGKKFYGEEYLYSDPMGQICSMSNIAAFSINDDTKEYIENIFSALLLSWEYYPGSDQIKKYRNFIVRYYHDDHVKMFDSAVAINKKALYGRRKIQLTVAEILEDFLRFIQSKKELYLYGTGKWGEEFYIFLKRLGIEINGFVITSNTFCDSSKKTFLGKPIYILEDLYADNNDYSFVLTLNEGHHGLVSKLLKEHGFSSWYPSDIGFNEIKKFIEMENSLYKKMNDIVSG